MFTSDSVVRAIRIVVLEMNFFSNLYLENCFLLGVIENSTEATGDIPGC
jgi:hypothetical protein